VTVKTIVVGFDGSEHAERALERAIDVAGSAEIVVVSAAGLTSGGGHARGGVSAVDPIEQEAAGQALEKARTRLQGKGLNARIVEAHGDAADALVNEAKSLNADLIVVGTRGHNLAQRTLLGSVSTKVVHDATCDVLVVR
jgi:nucleotide-binding universal stress UspA family protein